MSIISHLLKRRGRGMYIVGSILLGGIGRSRGASVSLLSDTPFPGEP